jgi:hypothetical protein
MKNTKKIKNNNYRSETSSSFTQKKPISFSKKESILFSHKSFLEILLNTIKKSQISLFSKVSDKKIPNKKIITEILTELKENLNSMHKEEKTKTYFYESQLLNQKSIIQSQLYEDKHKNKNLQKLKGEIEQLKTLNFMAQNEIKLIENLTEKNICIDKFLDKNVLTTEEEKEINCFQPKYFSTITRILHKNSLETKNQFQLAVLAKQRQDEEINQVIKSLEKLKYCISNTNIGYFNYIYAEDIIPEESKKYTQSMTLNNINKTINKILMNTNKNDESDSDNSSISNKIIKNKKDDNKLNNYINLNMNINLNFNFDKLYNNINEDIKYNTDREIKNNNKKEFFRREKGYLSTGNLPYLIIQSIKEEADSSGKIIEKNKVHKYNNKLEISNESICKEYLPTA